jgi:hypothetical protein
VRNQFQPGDEVTPVDHSDPWFGLRLEIVEIQQELAMVGERDFVLVTDSKSVRMFKAFELKYWPVSMRGTDNRLTRNPMRGYGIRKEDWPEELDL